MKLDYMTTIEAAKLWHITPRRISTLCTDGRIEGAVKKGNTWLIPSNAEKPEDARFKKTAC